MEGESLIETTGLTKRYNDRIAVNSLDFTVNEGEIFGFLGPNGAGKTTTLLMLLGLSEPSGGSANVCGLDPRRDPTGVKRVVGYLPENVGFYDDMNAVQSLEFVAHLNGIVKDKSAVRIKETIDLMGLGQDADKKVGKFSRGMKQRLGIAEVLIKEPKVLFLDEPTLGLDPDGALRLIELIGSLNREKQITVLLSSHNLYHVQKISSRVGIMIKGEMVAMGTMESLAQQKLGIDEKELSLEEIYMRYFQEE